jgi:hypothetical protein
MNVRSKEWNSLHFHYGKTHFESCYRDTIYVCKKKTTNFNLLYFTWFYFTFDPTKYNVQGFFEKQ